MESRKHNDELIKRKLADLSVEPRKLKFAEVHANYEKARKDSANKWGLYVIIGAVGIAALVSAYLLLTPKTSDQLAQNAVATEYSTEQAGNIQSVGTTSEDKSLERADKTTSQVNNTANDQAKLNESQGSLNNTNQTSANNTEASTEEKTTHESSVKESSSNNTSISSVTEKKSNNNTTTVKKKETNTSSNALNKKEASNNSYEETSSNNASTNSANKDASVNSATVKKATTKKTKASKKDILTNSSEQTKIGESVAKTDPKKQDQKAASLKDVKESDIKTEPTQPLANSDVNNKAKDQKDLKTDNTDIAKNETSENNNGKTDQSSVTQQGSNDQNNSSNTNNANSEGKDENSTHQIAKTDSISNNHTVANKVDSATATAHIPGVIGTGSVSPRNKHKFLIGAEVSYSTLFFDTKENPNSPSQFSTGDPAFNTAYANALGKGKHSLFNGAASLNYVYNEGVGVSAGVSYFSLETKVDIQPSRTPQYTTAIDYVVWNSVVDSSISPPTLTFVADTVYKQVPTGNYTSVGTTVNGDSVGTSSFVNKVRYISIPFSLSYNFKIGAKFSIEPQAGIIYTMPLKSSHLVATDAYKFEYKKQKADLRNNLYFHAALKIGYNINNRMQLYIREGYFFRNQSVYTGDQPISLSLKSIYTSFGITFRIK